MEEGLELAPGQSEEHRGSQYKDGAGGQGSDNAENKVSVVALLPRSGRH